ncbi:maltose acetyltransferase-domain-containing protein [Aspergillus heterothallicus]
MAATAKRPEIIEIARGLNHIPMCDDYEKMISGMMYNPLLPILAEARHRCRGVATDYNSLDTKTVSYEEIADKRMVLLKNVVGKVGEGTFIEPPFLPDYGCNVVIASQPSTQASSSSATACNSAPTSPSTQPATTPASSRGANSSNSATRSSSATTAGSAGT